MNQATEVRPDAPHAEKRGKMAVGGAGPTCLAGLERRRYGSEATGRSSLHLASRPPAFRHRRITARRPEYLRGQFQRVVVARNVDARERLRGAAQRHAD